MYIILIKHQIYIPGLYSCAVGIKECFSDDKIQKWGMTSKYVMKIYIQSHGKLQSGKPCENGKVTAQ
jgi:hypothetical protein